MTSNGSLMTPTNSSPDFNSSKLQQTSQSIPKLIRRSSVSNTTQKQNGYTTNQRRLTHSTMNNDFLNTRASSSLAAPLLIDTMNNFFEATKAMEEEIMLPSRLKDMPVEELVFDNSVQPDNWHDIYAFIREMRNQLQRTHPFAEDDDNNTNTNTNTTTTNNNNNSNVPQRKYSTDDEGIIIPHYDANQFSSASSTVSSDEFDQISTSSIATSYETIKDELKYHYYGLFRSLDNLTGMANRVAEKYREETTF
ncbi:unnamed protein product [Rotaria sp. Silwood1]|nr:unnamed protein product [Rotaria sp. Silwood1]CAF1325891.1 unnamed protein product [Rotaria sp. Silwood1]CAF3515201.1 unnamed protein product [Rotaria sp. Silwood1]CAF4710747.1 unnamed protein product [Rotaria sp. Silwood1]CAF4732302.1 unnamed protein product [Rotaria sp. Silwood1]